MSHPRSISPVGIACLLRVSALKKFSPIWRRGHCSDWEKKLYSRLVKLLPRTYNTKNG